MTNIKEQSPPQRMQGTQRRCPVCGAFPRFVQTMLDSRKGKVVRLFQCQCGEAFGTIKARLSWISQPVLTPQLSAVCRA